MILPIVAYGDPVLRKRGEDISEIDADTQKLIDDMFETMYNASGVGLAAPQVGHSLRIFVVDTSGFVDDDEEDEEALKGFRKVFINPEILEEDGEEWDFNEGCLSIPDIREDVRRSESLRIRYRDENFQEHTEEYHGLKARVIQHEYDHVEGVLFTDHLSPLRKRMLKSRLNSITRGRINVNYKMKFPRP